jgi:hypothetical protein
MLIVRSPPLRREGSVPDRASRAGQQSGRYDGNMGERPAATLPWVVLDVAGREITPTSEFLRELLACGNTPASCRSYAFDLLRWFPSVRHPW